MNLVSGFVVPVDGIDFVETLYNLISILFPQFTGTKLHARNWPIFTEGKIKEGLNKRKSVGSTQSMSSHITSQANLGVAPCHREELNGSSSAILRCTTITLHTVLS
ncbi:hypothetical protein SAMN05428978_1005114 [Nitrosomonas sp. Nm34]|nr:hypothetical protein SAMN05428978_1005114 [Nitrosomonas sp. Nm34]